MLINSLALWNQMIYRFMSNLMSLSVHSPHEDFDNTKWMVCPTKSMNIWTEIDKQTDRERKRVKDFHKNETSHLTMFYCYASKNELLSSKANHIKTAQTSEIHITAMCNIQLTIYSA